MQTAGSGGRTILRKKEFRPDPRITREKKVGSSVSGLCEKNRFFCGWGNDQEGLCLPFSGTLCILGLKREKLPYHGIIFRGKG